MFKKLTSQKVSIVLIISFLLINIFAIFVTAFFLNDSKKQYKEQAISNAKSYTDILSNNTSRTFEKAEIILNSIDNQIKFFGLNSTTKEFLKNESHFLLDVHDVLLIDSDGSIKYSVNNSNQIKKYNTEAFFQKTINSDNDDILITHEFDQNEEQIVFSKKIYNNQNIIIGIIALILPNNSIIQSFSGLDVGPNGLLSLRDEKLKFIARYPALQYLQRNTPPSKTLLELTSKLDSGVYETNTPLDGKKRQFVFKKLNRFGYFIIVGLSELDYLAPWRTEFIQFSFIYLFFSLISALGTYGIYFFWKKDSQKENRLSSILHSATEGIYGIDDNGLCTFCNPKALSLLGYSENEIIGKPINQIIFAHSDDIKDGLLLNTNIERELKTKSGKSFFAEMWQHPQIYDNEISSTIITFIDISDKKDMNMLVWKQANYDSLTSIPNRSFFEDKLQDTITEYSFSGEKFAVLFIDLDNFKDINDNYGHNSGDELLTQVAERLTHCVRDRDIVARLGGDEFTIILNKIKSKDDIKHVCEKIIKEIQKPFIINQQPCNVGSSIGVTYFPEDASSLKQLLQNADKAMYVAKESGRNRYSFFSKDLDLIIKQRLEIAQDLRIAIEENQFQLFIQPIVDTISQKIKKAEILLRWKHPTKDYISPADFIPIAEKNGLIHIIGDWVFKNSVLWLKDFLINNPNNNNFQISINVSPLQFMNSNFIDKIKECILPLNLPEGSVIIEITEGILLEHNNNHHQKFTELKELGIKIAIDDFGTGYSAMSYLYKYDIDFIKVDKRFICDLKKEKNKKITRSLVSMAKNLGLEVIAEGVETEGQSKFLQDIQCDYSQGFYHYKPLSIYDFSIN